MFEQANLCESRGRTGRIECCALVFFGVAEIPRQKDGGHPCPQSGSCFTCSWTSRRFANPEMRVHLESNSQREPQTGRGKARLVGCRSACMSFRPPADQSSCSSRGSGVRRNEEHTSE